MSSCEKRGTSQKSQVLHSQKISDFHTFHFYCIHLDIWSFCPRVMIVIDCLTEIPTRSMCSAFQKFCLLLFSRYCPFKKRINGVVSSIDFSHWFRIADLHGIINFHNLSFANKRSIFSFQKLETNLKNSYWVSFYWRFTLCSFCSFLTNFFDVFLSKNAAVELAIRLCS